ncbi:hypothetical protein PYCCODRAFT_331233 [Trametes coccinea BRFM310]|uniref:Aminoglycoside phosphotransferase domain-containing protein n=1 Tax=Trametes coccinea (strain BRFM310) TaxID=1353009 RepID=A0A1Y2IPQ2_TRAC3|nr:hypothetical protein PYCCODRAFT_331233 [Trametes coccinea BRFM310]
MHPYAEDLFAPHIFAPPQEEIACILPHLVWPDRTLHVLGRRTHGQNAIYDLVDGRVLKTGRTTSFDEAKAMIIVRAHTNIPVPKVYMVFEHRCSTHIVMERIDGVAHREA